jgi:hypothetical protein
VNEVRSPWPAYLYDDYIGAAVRLATVMQEEGQHLLFACVELYPHEIPLPPKHTVPLEKPIGKRATFVSTIAVMSVRDALKWYEGALRGQLKVPGIAGDVNVAVCQLAPEPAFGRLVTGSDLPFGTRWHCGPRIHHLVPMEDPPAALSWLLPDSQAQRRTAAREWLVGVLGFDVLAYDEYLFSLVLLAPNPVVRSATWYIRDKLPDGGERIGISVVPRHRTSLSDVQVLFREERAEGTSLLRECELDGYGLGEIDLPQPCGRSRLEIISGSRGVLGIFSGEGFWRDVSVESRILAQKGKVSVPGRRKTEASSTYPVGHWEPQLTRARQVPTSSPQRRVLELKERRATRSGKARPEAMALGEDGEERLFFQDRDRAVRAICGLIAHAQSTVVFVDPFFSHVEVRQFAFATQLSGVGVHVLVGRGENLWVRERVEDPASKALGDLFAEDLRALEEEVKRMGLRLPDVKLMGDKARTYHDRFLVIDGQIWHVGHSFNQIGENEVSMATRLRYPDEIHEWIIEDVARATPFLEGWPVLKERRITATDEERLK